MVYPTLPRKKQQEPIRENNVDPLAPFPNKKIQNPTTQDPNSKFHIEQIQNPNPQNIQKIYILRGSEMVYPTLPRKKQQEPISENNVDPLAPFPNKKIKNPTTQDPNSKFHIEQIQNPNPQNIQKIYILRGSEMVYPTLPRKKQQEPISENNVDPSGPFLEKKDQKYGLQNSHKCKLLQKTIHNPRSKKKIQQKFQSPILKLQKSKFQIHQNPKSQPQTDLPEPRSARAFSLFSFSIFIIYYIYK